MSVPSKKPEQVRPRWRLEPDEIPPELSDNFIVRYLAELSPEEEASLQRVEAMKEEDEPIDDG